MSHLMNVSTNAQQISAPIQIPQQAMNTMALNTAQQHPPNSVQTTTTSMQPQSHEQRYDLIARVRSLVWQLKDSLATLMRVAASNIQHNSQIDSGLKISEEQVLHFDKALEDFFSICNQIELHLKTILECAIQAKDSQQYLPFPISTVKTDNLVDPNNENAISYSQYLITIKSQVNFAKSIHDSLIEGAKRITQMDLPLNAAVVSGTSSNSV